MGPRELHMLWIGCIVVASIALFVLAWRATARRRIFGGGAVMATASSFAGAAHAFGRQRAAWRPFETGAPENRAFAEWRAAELARLEEQRRKLDATHRDFAAFVESLRRAKDREEYDRFRSEFANAHERRRDASPERPEDHGRPAPG